MRMTHIRCQQRTSQRATLKATLVYTDWEGPLLQNNLNLTVAVNYNVKQVVWKNDTVITQVAKISIIPRAIASGNQDYPERG